MFDRHLLSFVELARLPMLRQLASRLHVTPATLSLRIKALEESLGVKLFEHEGQRLALSMAGKRLLPIAESILDGYSELQAMAKHMSRDPERSVRIGVIESVVHTFLPSLLRLLADRLSEVKVELSLDLTRNLYAQLLAGEVDLIICVGDTPFADHTVVEDLLTFPVHWIASAQSSLQDAELPVVLKRRLFTQMANTVPYHAVVAMLNGLHMQGDEPSPAPTVIGSPSLAALVAMVRQDLGVSIMPGIFVKDMIDAGQVIRLPLPQPRPSLVSQCHLSRPTVATAAVAKTVRELCSTYASQHEDGDWVRCACNRYSA